MIERTTYLAFVPLVALLALFAPSAQAKYVALFREVGSDVIETGRGTLDLTDLTNLGGSSAVTPSVVPNDPFFSTGAIGAQLQIFVGKLIGPTEFGAGGETVADKSSGDGVGVFRDDDFGLLAPVGYVFGAPLAETSTYLFATFASLGTRPGEYVWSWGSGPHADTFTVEVGGVFSPVPEPSTWAMMLVGFAGLGYAAARRMRARRAVSA